MPLANGYKLAQYEIVGPLGAGGMREGYLARDPRLQREVAVKVLPAALAADRDWRSVLLDPSDVVFLDPHAARVRSEIGAETFAAAERQGRAVPYEAALAEVRAWLEGTSS